MFRKIAANWKNRRGQWQPLGEKRRSRKHQNQDPDEHYAQHNWDTKIVVVTNDVAGHMEELPMVQRQLQRSLSRDSFSTITTAAETPRSSMTLSSASYTSDNESLPTEIIIPNEPTFSTSAHVRSPIQLFSVDDEEFRWGNRNNSLIDDEKHCRHHDDGSLEENILPGSSSRRYHYTVPPVTGIFHGARVEI